MNNISNNNKDSNDNSTRADDDSFKMEAQAQNFNTFCDLCDPQIESDNGDSLQVTEEGMTPPGDATSKKISQVMPDFGCICEWEKCRVVSQQFFLHGNDGHPWKGPSFTWKASTSKKTVILVKNLLFRAGVFCSLKVPKKMQTKYSHRFRVARHHFPLALWEEIGVNAKEQIKKRGLEIVPNLGTKVLIFPVDSAAAADDSVRQFMKMVGTEETTESYSSLLLKTHSFREFAKLSSIGPARSWFENVMNGKQEGHFDTLCQQINWKLVNMLAKAGAAKSGAKNDDEKKAVSYQFQIWELVEKKDLEGLVSDTCPIGDRMGVIALIQILDEAIEQKLWAGMIERAELLRKNSNKEKPFHYRDVNSIFGWAVFHARKAKMKERFRRNDDEEKYAELTKEIEFLSAMRMYKSEAALSDHYLENCYHDTMRTSDRGHMTLVREEFFEFGYMLMDNLSSSVTEGKLLSKMEVLRLEKEAILNNTPLWEMWKVSSEKVQCVTEGDRKKMFEYVVKKTVHTKFEDVFKGLRGKLTARGTKQNISGLSFRGEMKGMDRKKTVRTK